MLKIVVGLGNPGEEYKRTRHNAGFMFLEYLEQKYNLDISKRKFDSKILETNLFNNKVVLAKPQTFMNLSGNAVLKLKNWYKVDNSEILVIFDDIDIDFGNIRYKLKGSGGTHNGMKNIVQMLNTIDIARVRIGIGGVKNNNQDLCDFVLSKFSNEEICNLENEVFFSVEEKLKEFLDK